MSPSTYHLKQSYLEKIKALCAYARSRWANCPPCQETADANSTLCEGARGGDDSGRTVECRKEGPRETVGVMTGARLDSVAKFICESGGWGVSNLQLQKIIYMAQMYYMGSTVGSA